VAIAAGTGFGLTLAGDIYHLLAKPIRDTFSGLGVENRLVFTSPAAPLKIYLDASPAERARRRHRELAEAGVDRSEADILAELEQRDEMDRQRHLSPLRPAADALVIDTDDLTLEEVVDRVRAAAGAPATG